MVVRVAYVLPGDSGGLEDPILFINSIRFGVNLPPASIHYQESVFAVEGHAMLTSLRPAPDPEGMLPDHAELGKRPQDLLGIWSLHGVVRVTELSSDRYCGAGGFDAHGPVSNI